MLEGEEVVVVVLPADDDTTGVVNDETNSAGETILPISKSKRIDLLLGAIEERCLCMCSCCIPSYC